MRRRSLALAVTLVLTGLLETACGVVPLPCDIAIAALPVASTIAPGDPLPADLQLLARPADVDQTASRILMDTTGNASIDLVLRGESAGRLAAYTTDHIGEPMAVAINGTVVAVPIINAAIPDGQVQITAGGPGGGRDLANLFEGCVR